MKILCLVRQVPDAESNLRIAENAVHLASTQMVMDTMDEYGLEQALRLKDAGAEAEIVALAVGPAKNEEVLRSALALGADRAVHVKTDASLDPLAISSIVAGLANTEGVDLIFCGGRESDWDSEALGGAIAERLDWPQITWATEVAFSDGEVKGRHDTDGGTEGFSVALPAVVTTQQGLNEPRFATLPNIVKSRKKELRQEPPDQYEAVPSTTIVKSELQPRARLRNIITDAGDPGIAVETLVEVLRKEIGGNA